MHEALTAWGTAMLQPSVRCGFHFFQINLRTPHHPYGAQGQLGHNVSVWFLHNPKLYIWKFIIKSWLVRCGGWQVNPQGQTAMWKLRQISKSFQALVLKTSLADCRELSMPWWDSSLAGSDVHCVYKTGLDQQFVWDLNSYRRLILKGSVRPSDHFPF